MSWLSDLFQNPQLGYSPNLEPPGWNLLRDQLMRKIFTLQGNPYGFDPSKGQSMNSLLPTGGRGLFNPYSGGYGGGAPGAGGGGGGGPMRPMQSGMQPMGRGGTIGQALGHDARMPVTPASPRPSGPGVPGAPRPEGPPGAGAPAGGGVQPMAGTTPTNPSGTPGNNPNGGWTNPGGGYVPPTYGAGGGGLGQQMSRYTFFRNVPGSETMSGDFGAHGPNDNIGNMLVPPAQRPPDANPGIGNALGHDASPYMFQRGPELLGRDGPPSFSNDAGMAPQPYNDIFRQNQNAYFGGNPADMLRAAGFNWNNGPQGTTFNRGGSSYLNQGASHEGGGFGGQSAWLQGMGFKPGMGQGNLPGNRQYGGQLGMLDKMMASIAQGNRRGMASGGAMGTQLAPVSHPAGFHSGMGGGAQAPAQPRIATATPPMATPQTNLARAGGGGMAPPQTNLGQSKQVLMTDGVPMGNDGPVPDPVAPMAPGGSTPTKGGDQGVATLLMSLLGSGGGSGMPDINLLRRQKPLGYDSALGVNRMKDWGMRGGNMPSPY